MPALAASVSIQASDLASGEVKVMTELNKTLRFAKSAAQQRMKFLAKPEKNQKRNIHDLAVIMFVDAAFSVRKDPGSRGGYIILAGDAQVLRGEKTPMSILAWRSFKLNRDCRSSPAAGCQALSIGLEELLLVKNYLTHLQFPEPSLKEVQQKASGQCAVITDCKSLFDGIKRETIQQPADKRVSLECLVTKELFESMKCLWKWIFSARQLADGLTKIAARQNFSDRFRGHHVPGVRRKLHSSEEENKGGKKIKKENNSGDHGIDIRSRSFGGDGDEI